VLTKTLLGMLALELLSEVSSSFISIFTPAWGLEEFHVQVSTDTVFLAFVLGLAFTFVSSIIVLAIYYIYQKVRFGWYLSYTLGAFWIAFGGSLFAVYGRTENLYLDFCPGLIVSALTYVSYAKEGIPGRS
jgi:hypothetical protein